MVEADDGTLLPFRIRLRRRDEPPAEPILAPSGPLLLRRDGALEAYDREKGERRWTWIPRGPVPGKAVRLHSSSAGGSAVAVLDGDGVLRCLDLEGGRELWTANAGPGRAYDPSSTALLAGDRAVYFVTADGRSRGGIQVEARDLLTGAPLWAAPLSGPPVLVEILPAGPTLIVKYLSAGAGGDGRSGVAVVDRSTGKVVDRVEDDRLGGEGFEAAAISGVLAVANERVAIVRGR